MSCSCSQGILRSTALCPSDCRRGWLSDQHSWGRGSPAVGVGGGGGTATIGGPDSHYSLRQRSQGSRLEQAWVRFRQPGNQSASHTRLCEAQGCSLVSSVEGTSLAGSVHFQVHFYVPPSFVHSWHLLEGTQEMRSRCLPPEMEEFLQLTPSRC